MADIHVLGRTSPIDLPESCSSEAAAEATPEPVVARGPSPRAGLPSAMDARSRIGATESKAIDPMGTDWAPVDAEISARHGIDPETYKQTFAYKAVHSPRDSRGNVQNAYANMQSHEEPMLPFDLRKAAEVAQPPEVYRGTGNFTNAHRKLADEAAKLVDPAKPPPPASGTGSVVPNLAADLLYRALGPMFNGM